MKAHNHGWALLEVVIAMALMGLATSTVTAMQLQSLATIHRALKDAQNLGLATEILETHALRMGSSTLEASWDQQMQAIDARRRFRLDRAAAGDRVEILAPAPPLNELSVRWQLPMEP